MFDKEVKTNKHGVNSNIRSCILSEDKMKKVGFTHAHGVWYLCKGVKTKDKRIDITFNVTIKDDNSDFMIDVLDEDFLQPYDYQRILRHDPHHELALVVLDQVEDWMEELQTAGVLSGHKRGEYI